MGKYGVLGIVTFVKRRAITISLSNVRTRAASSVRQAGVRRRRDVAVVTTVGRRRFGATL